MRRIPALLIFGLVFLGVQSSAKADGYVVPAGTLLRCTLDEPNFSSKTADVGDPVICHLSSLSQFGHNLLPRGSYLGGHLESAKEPGHFWGKGYLKIEFDRIGFPSSDVPVPAKVIAAKGYKVDKHGDIVGKGHATRDAIEWLIPPLWPWKVLTLPARGPRPAMKGEEQLTLRLMDDIEIPRVGAAYHSVDRPPASYHSQQFHKPSAYEQPAVEQQPAEQAQLAQPAMQTASSTTEAPYVATQIPVDTVAAATAEPQNTAVADLEPARTQQSQPARIRLIALRSGNVYAVSQYRINNGSVSFVLENGKAGSVDITEVDWRMTSRLSAEPTAPAVDTDKTY